ncbi:MAG TPA: DNA (cytosine-5-)-methyltransferase [Clostridiaceae bacterium]|nr:DNA (cytosine-5-)-methyltransferase [Clostridiaceae bacterium]
MDALNLIETLSQYKSKAQIAKEVGVNESTVRRWLKGECKPKQYIVPQLTKMLDDIIPHSDTPQSFTFIDLFAGIGGIRRPFEAKGGKCVFTSEWDTYAQRTYAVNYPSDEPIAGDITKIKEHDIPNHDVLLAGFPCQPFSIAGVSKKNSLGRSHGFKDKAQGTLFFDVARIINAKRPKVFVLENVKNLYSHDKGRTFRVIMDVLQNDLKYNVYSKVIDGQHFVPQHRERIVIIGFLENVNFSWDNLKLPEKGIIKMNSILHKTDGTEPFLPHDGDKYFDYANNCVHEKYTLSDSLWDYLQRYAEKHQAKGNGFGFGLVDEDSIARTLSARYYKDGSEILVYQGPDKNPRRLTPRECARLMGFDDSFKIPVSDTRAYKQFGNSVVVPVFERIADMIIPLLKDHH